MLIKVIFEYRQRNDQPIGDIERDIDNYYCSRWPSACHGSATSTAPRRESLINRIARWASMTFRSMPRGGYQLVTAPEAVARGQTCVGCPRNIPWRGGCTGCSNSTVKLLLELKRARKTAIDGNLLGCDVGGWANDCAVWLPPSATPITDDQRQLMPARCWRKNLP